MTPRLRKLLLTLHITVSVGWFGAAASFLALAFAGLHSRDVQMVRTAYAAMELTARFVIIPLAVASLLSGTVQSLGTPWGLFRHSWVLAKLLLTSLATIVLLAKMPLIGYAARRASVTTSSSDADLHMAGIQLAAHAAGGLLVLLIITALSVYKPWGLTQYGQRKQQEQRKEPWTRPKARGDNELSSHDNVTVGNRRSGGLRISLAVGVGVTVSVAHIFVFLNAHHFLRSH